MTKTPPQDPGDETAPPPAAEPLVIPPNVTEHCARGQHYQCHGTVFIWPPDDNGDSYVLCACPVPNCGHGRRDRVKPRRR